MLCGELVGVEDGVTTVVMTYHCSLLYCVLVGWLVDKDGVVSLFGGLFDKAELRVIVVIRVVVG